MKLGFLDLPHERRGHDVPVLFDQGGEPRAPGRVIDDPPQRLDGLELDVGCFHFGTGLGQVTGREFERRQHLARDDSIAQPRQHRDPQAL